MAIAVISLLIAAAQSGTVSATGLTFPDDDAFMTDLAQEIATAMEAFQPRISTHVLSVDETGVFINAGTRDRALVGMRFNITNPRTGEITIIQLNRVEHDYSHGVIVSGPFPDIMYGARYVPEEAWVNYIVPPSEPEEKAGIFISLAFAVETAEGWHVASVGNSKWRYSASGKNPPPLKTFTCELSFTEYMHGIPAALFTIGAPGGERLDGGITYSGDWVPLRPSNISGFGPEGWFRNEAYLPQDVYAIEAADITGDGAAELVVAGDASIMIYKREGDYLKLKYRHYFTSPRLESLPFGELGYLGLLRQSNGWRFYVRGPRHAETAVCDLKGGVFSDPPGEMGVPLASAKDGKRVVLAKPLDTYHLFKSDGMTTLTASEGIPMSVSGSAAFLAVGDFNGVPGYETAYLDKNSIPNLMVGGVNIRGEFSWGAGLWAFDFDGDGQDELVTTGRKVDSDHLEFYRFNGDRFLLTEVSPEFDGSIIDAAFADFDGDGKSEPAVLVVFGREKRIIF